MGGQRDVDDAPPITDYGFDASLTNFEGMGPKLLPLTLKPGQDKPDRIWGAAEQLGNGHKWMLRSKITGGFVSAAISFIEKAVNEKKPFYINLWPDDVHSPFWPPVDKWGNGKKRTLYHGVLHKMDEQLGVLFDYIHNSKKLRSNTLILVCSDNGPEKGAGSAGPFRGFKTMLFEGGVRSPLVVWGPGRIDSGKAGTVNRTSVMAAIDLVPSLLALTGVAPPDEVAFDGQALAEVLTGRSQASRAGSLFFRRPSDRHSFHSVTSLPDLAVRNGRWKLLCSYDSSNPQLYDLDADRGETKNIAQEHPEVVQRLSVEVVEWHKSMPDDNGSVYRPRETARVKKTKTQ
jgi:uncharacterized sulfatase